MTRSSGSVPDGPDQDATIRPQLGLGLGAGQFERAVILPVEALGDAHVDQLLREQAQARR
jgi:hypothetical protein